jgi:dolichol-phosphate mannosyltransferase
MKCVVVMPMYNERPNIETIVPAVLSNGPEWNVLIVDDNSPDGTGEVADRMAAEGPRVRVIHRKGKMGLGTAYRDGLSAALDLGADYVCTMDSDFSHDPKALPSLRALAERDGAAHGSRYVKGGRTEDWGFARKLNSSLANWLTRVVLGVRLRDCTSGFRCFRRDVLARLQPRTLRAEGYAVLEELLARCAKAGVTPAEYPIVFVDRKAGESKINFGESIRALFVLLRLRLERWEPPAEPGM